MNNISITLHERTSDDEEDGNETDDEDGIASSILAQRYHRAVPVNSW